MSKRRRRSPSTAPALRLSESLSHRSLRLIVWLAGSLLFLSLLATLYLRAPSGDDTPSWTGADGLGPLELPTEPAPATVDQLRQESKLIVTELLDRYPRAAGAHRAAAILYQFLNQYSVAVKHWEAYIALNAADAKGLFWLGKLQVKQGNDSEAAKTLSEARQAGVNSVELYEELTLALQRLGRMAEAETAAKEGVQLWPDSAELWVALGKIQLQQRRLEEARASLEAALRIDPELHTAHLTLANVCHQLGLADQASEHQRQVEQRRSRRQRDLHPFEEGYETSLRYVSASVLALAAEEYDSRGETLEAERLCRRAIEVDPTCPDSYRQLANMYHRQGRAGDGLLVQRRLLELEPDNVVNYVNFANLAWQMERADEAESALLEAVRRSPEHAGLHQAAANFYGRIGNPVKARQFAEKAAALSGR